MFLLKLQYQLYNLLDSFGHISMHSKMFLEQFPWILPINFLNQQIKISYLISFMSI